MHASIFSLHYTPSICVTQEKLNLTNRKLICSEDTLQNEEKEAGKLMENSE